MIIGSEASVECLLNKTDSKIETSFKIYSAVKMLFLDQGNDSSI